MVTAVAIPEPLKEHSEVARDWLPKKAIVAFHSLPVEKRREIRLSLIKVFMHCRGQELGRIMEHTLGIPDARKKVGTARAALSQLYRVTLNPPTIQQAAAKLLANFEKGPSDIDETWDHVLAYELPEKRVLEAFLAGCDEGDRQDRDAQAQAFGMEPGEYLNLLKRHGLGPEATSA